MGSHAFSPEELHRWKELLERRHTWCNKRGIDYFFVLAPTKFSVYPEFLPWEYANYPRRTRTDELIDFLKQTRSPVQVIDLRSSLRTAKSTLPLYLRTDTHWNQLGAYYGYKSMIELLRERQPSISPPSSLANFNLKARRFGTGDLARMQGLLGVLTETTIELDHKEQSTVKLYRESNFSENVVGQEETRAFGYHQDRSDLPSMLMFRDSFAAFMIELPLPEHFSRSTYFWQPEFSESIVLREKPDIVIQEMLESCLYLPPQEM